VESLLLTLLLEACACMKETDRERGSVESSAQNPKWQ